MTLKLFTDHAARVSRSRRSSGRSDDGKNQSRHRRSGHRRHGRRPLLLDHGDRTARHAGRKLWLEKAVVRDLKKARDCDLPTGVLTDDLDEVINDPEIKVVAQLVGGLEPARTIMLKLLESGKDVVTANKALLAEHGAELFDRARELGRSIAFEASVAGGIPIIANISQCLSANQIAIARRHPQRHEQLHPHQDGRRRHGVRRRVSPRPSGWATPRPIRRSTSTAPTPPRNWRSWPTSAFGARVHWKEIPRVGIDTVDVATCITPRSWAIGSSCWPWPSWSRTGWSCTSRRRWCAAGRPAGRGQRAVQRDPRRGRRGRRSCSIYGQGAGQMPTASAVVADLIDTAVGRDGDHLPHARAVVESQGPRDAAATTPRPRAGSTCG